jgi:SAM-dependent methyltransferase/FKBP-type peptidyl-prolyl cis-trans isomerase 2
MNTIENNSVADLFFQMNWSSDMARHTDAYAGLSVNFWRDLFPRRLKSELSDKRTGDQLKMAFSPEELFANGRSRNIQRLARAQFDPDRIGSPELRPMSGRFYPKGLLKDMAGVFKANREPFRCVEVKNGHLDIDTGHPLSQRPVTLSVSVGAVNSKSHERGGELRDWIETISQGVGMQARWQGHPTDFFSGAPFTRADESPDGLFYEIPRMVQHLDDTALDMVRQLYGRFAGDGMRVLDVMGSWDSHLPAGIAFEQVVGVGLNRYELEHNPVLTDRIEKDLNVDPNLDLPDNHFDIAVCTVSVEYVTQPTALFSEVARTLRPGGTFIVIFSNRWFDPKVVRIWKELHEFERMGLVLEYFHDTSAFDHLQTYSVRGLSRPTQDKYFGQLRYADPVYAVWGQKK